jgi:hypothetical protein
MVEISLNKTLPGSFVMEQIAALANRESNDPPPGGDNLAFGLLLAHRIPRPDQSGEASRVTQGRASGAGG